MSKRSNWCEFDKETRKYIKKRDKEQCIICHNKNGLQIMHIFLSRAMGGKGCKENGCLGCTTCHKIIDNPIGTKQNELSKKYLEYCKNYLMEHEEILKTYKDEKDLVENLLKFDKKKLYNTEINFDIPAKSNLTKSEEMKNISEYKYIKRCKDCSRLIKIPCKGTTLCKYRCKYRKLYLSKNTGACKNFLSIVKYK